VKLLRFLAQIEDLHLKYWMLVKIAACSGTEKVDMALMKIRGLNVRKIFGRESGRNLIG